MMHNARARSVLFRGLGFHALALFYAWHFAGLRMSRPMWAPAAFERMVAGTAISPFQFRALIPWTVSLLRDLPGLSQVDLSVFRFGSELLFTFLLLVAFRTYMSGVLGGWWRPVLASLVLALVLPFHYLIPQEFPFYYAYDIPSVFFFTLGLHLLRTRRWPLYYAVFTVATFNRESTCFLAVVYLCTAFGRDRWAVILGHLAAQFAIWIAIKGLLFSLYGGTTNFVHFTRNIYMLRLPATYPVLFSAFGYTWILALAGFRRIEDEFVRRACFIVPLFAGVIFVVGQLRELRLYGELIPVVVPAAILAAGGLLQGAADRNAQN